VEIQGGAAFLGSFMEKIIALAAALLLTVPSAFAAPSWYMFTNKAGNSFEGSVIEVDTDLEEALVIVKKSGRNTTIDFKVLSDADIDYLRSWHPESTGTGGGTSTTPEEEEPAAVLGEASTRLYPHSRSEVEARISAIKERKPPEGIGRGQQETINLLNVYRFLCGVEPDAVADKQKVAEAHQAAAACEKHGGLSHSIGSYTNKCNLHSGSNMLSSVRGYIGDGGDNNRNKRGHRRWCLNPQMVKTGFGDSGRYSAMWSLDHSGSGKKENWSYPGAGFFPKEYLHGNAWSFYMPTPVPQKDKLTVEVFRLSRRPDKKFGITADIPGRIVKVGYVYSYSNTINFEPDQELVRKGGVFWVRIRGGGVREGYLVELY
jgi:hypothetical protein